MVSKRKVAKKRAKAKKRVVRAKARKRVQKPKAKRLTKKSRVRKAVRHVKKVSSSKKVQLKIPRNFVLGHPVFYVRPPLFVRNKLKKQEPRKLLSRPEN